MKKLVILAALSMALAVASAQSLKVSTGSSTGTYSRMQKELSTVCINQMQMVEMNSSGATQNLDRIIGNEVNGGFVQTDVIYFRSRTEDIGNIKTLVALHPEEVHLVAMANSNIKEGGTLGFGAKTVTLNTVNDLAGRTVAAAGGSYVTAQVIRLQSEIPFNVVEVASGDDAIKAVAAGTAQAALLVGGQPLGNVAALDKNYKLLNFPEATAAKLKNVYRPARVNYSKMGQGGAAATVATDALFVAKEYKTPKFQEGLAKLRDCITKNAPELGETVGMHPVWSKVDVNNQGKWAYMQLPVAATTKK